jgi:type IV pilus assembly protein PilA
MLQHSLSRDMRNKNKGFTIIEIMIVVGILGILSAIAVPIYQNYISNSRQNSANLMLEQFGILLETFRAENGQFPPVNTYLYQEDGAGNVTTDTITALLPGFKPKSASTSNTNFHYSIAVSNSGTATEQAVVTVTGVDAYAGTTASATYN